MSNVTVIYTQDKLKLIFKDYKIQEDGVMIELSAEEADDLIAYIEMSDDLDNGF